MGSLADGYRARAAELSRQAEAQTNRDVQLELQALARGYLRLAEEAERHGWMAPPGRSSNDDGKT